MTLPKHIDATREPIVESCVGCNRVNVEGEVSYCKAYVRPAAWWKHGRYCPLASHFKIEAGKSAKVNPLKASKRASGKKK
jgi:hypothetical protein